MRVETSTTADLRATAPMPSPVPPKEEKMSLLSVEISRERIQALEEEIASLQWAAEIRRNRRETLAKVVSDTSRATRQEAGITLRRARRILLRR
ncbi:hypothetical protein [Actinocorallia longicatena]|uniref:50S ribosomal protein L29 n=1 Tax=Actinocorallia longicatena TaxID=111803 RepID=A0ABP6Q104_9ACTN